MHILERIVKVKQEEVSQLSYTTADWDRAIHLPPARSLARALTEEKTLSIIAEVKPASPVRGVIRKQIEPAAIAKGYERAGAKAISVLTDVSFFKAKHENLPVVKQVVQVPVLRKDFIIDPKQIIESKLLGADAILLIATILTKEQLKTFTEIAHELSMEVLVEVYDASELERALACQGDVLGINNRNLTDFTVDLGHTERVFKQIDASIPIISESGILSIEDAKKVAQIGVDGVLIGEYFMRQADPEAAVRQMIGELNEENKY
jgi:indole-3-glycerol phosphate synthase